MDKNTIRSIIFLVAGLVSILFPKQLFKFQTAIYKKLHIKYGQSKELKEYLYIGIFFVLISIILFVFSIIT